MARTSRFIAMICVALSLAFAAAGGASAQSRAAVQGYADLAERLTPAVVNIATTPARRGR